MRTSLTLTLLIFLFSCDANNQKNDTKKNISETKPIKSDSVDTTTNKKRVKHKSKPKTKFEEFYLINNTDNFKYTQYEDSTFFDYKNYTVTIIPSKTDVGESICIFNKTRKRTDKSYGFFKGLIDNFFILDFGTSAYRNLEIYNLDNMKKIFSTGYYNHLFIIDKSIHFQTLIKINDENRKPKCPEKFKNSQNDIGYLEEQYFDLESLKLHKTGNYECTILE
jgi:hypothetical protein